MVKKVKTKNAIVQRIMEERERGDKTSLSDVDILVEFMPEKHTFDNFMEVAFFLEEILGHKVELVTPEALSPHIGPHILREVEHVPIAA